jgi:N-acetyl-gamma-glutamyl-phosphate reductase
MKVFIDGQAGTTGLMLEGRLKARDDISLLEIDPALRKDRTAKQEIMAEADVIFLCLPDDEAKISAELAPKNSLVIDASTAHRTHPNWAYGLPELSQKHREAIAGGKRISVPGCHACGFNAMAYPLLESGIIPKEAWLNCTSITGYSGGGRPLIEKYEQQRSPGDALSAPRPYALGLTHKHLPEMMKVSGLVNPPHFYPIVGDMAQGMLVTLHLVVSNLITPKIIRETLERHYKNSHFIRVKAEDTEGGFLDPTKCNGTNNMDLFVFGHDELVLTAARLDNLGKGASGAAIQCMNIALGLDETIGMR